MVAERSEENGAKMCIKKRGVETDFARCYDRGGTFPIYQGHTRVYCLRSCYLNFPTKRQKER